VGSVKTCGDGDAGIGMTGIGKGAGADGGYMVLTTQKTTK
jgi:hypothetical protein